MKKKLKRYAKIEIKTKQKTIQTTTKIIKKQIAQE